MKTIGLMLCVIGMLGSPALAQKKTTTTTKPMQLTAEQRTKMADLHEKMAACLRSDRPLAECHEQMMNGCREAMGSDTCPMMGPMKQHGPMMQQDQTK